jgi:hypothetical protein
MIKAGQMKYSFYLRLIGFCSCLFLSGTNCLAQAKLVLNGAKINLANKSYLVLENPAPDAIIRKSGYVLSEGESNRIKWNLGTHTGTYNIPWGFENTNYLPLSFTKSAGSGNGFYEFSTYHTGWQNSQSLPGEVTNLTNGNEDNSAFVLDRFWRIEAQGYTNRPALTNVVFTYTESELNDPHNYITENGLGVQGWNNDIKSWSGLQAVANLNTDLNTLTVTSLPSDSNYNWWALVDKASPLPLELVSFEARKIGKAVKLNWMTTNENNCASFEIQRSTDAVNFTIIGKESAKNSQQNIYNFTDNSPLTDLSYYRLKQNDIDGTFSYTSIRSIHTNGLAKINIYPNPTENNTIQVDMGEMPLGNYNFVLHDQQGRIVYSVEKNIRNEIFQIKFPAQLTPGLYLLKVRSSGYILTSKLILQ